MLMMDLVLHLIALLRFAGVFQTYKSDTPLGVTYDDVCPSLIQKHPLTGDYTCPPPYEAVLFYNGEKQAS